jgi:RimJ/RimL family protein N-acetyltransferase
MLSINTPTYDDLYRVGEWRNRARPTLRTPTMTQPQNQEQWYKSLDPNQHRYWGMYPWVEAREGLVAFGGLTNISWENRSAEISLIVDPDLHRQGYGTESVGLLLDEGFYKMNLEVIYGEVYECNPNLAFWRKVVADCDDRQWQARTATLPDRKYWNGAYYNSLYFSIRR